MRATLQSLATFWNAPGVRPAMLISAILLAAMCLRMAYAHGLPPNYDEGNYAEVASTISLWPSTFHLPIASRQMDHPILCVYITALGLWIGQGSILFVRFLYIMISVVGLLGVLRLAQVLFGFRAAIVALALAAIDRHLVTNAVYMLEPVHLALVPWTLLVMYRCVTLESRRSWIVLGILTGVGYLVSEIFLILGAPFVLYVLITGKLLRVLRNPWAWLGAGVAALFIAPNLLWNYFSSAPSVERSATRIGPFGLSPRFLILYLGDILIGLKDSTWVVMARFHAMWPPVWITCFSFAGAAYLASAAWSLRYMRDNRMALLVSAVAGIAAPVSLMNAREPWNEFGWASATVFPAICLTAYVADRLLNYKFLRWAGAAAGVLLLGATVHFLLGPKYAYPSPFWEKAMIGEVFWNIKTHRSGEALAVVEEAARRHPDSAITQVLRGTLTRDEAVRSAAMNKALELDPYNALALFLQAKVLGDARDWPGAMILLRRALDHGGDFYEIHHHIAIAAFGMGDYAEAEKEALAGLEMKPDAYHLYEVLFFTRNAKGDAQGAQKAIDRLARGEDEPYLAYLRAAKVYASAGQFDLARRYYEQARQLKGDLESGPAWLRPPN